MKNEIKRAIILVVCITLVVVGIKFFQNVDKTDKYLKKKGYSENDITIIHKYFDETKINTILNMDYNENLTKILENDYYIPEHLFDYLDYAKKTNYDINTVIGIINVKANKDWYSDINQVEKTDNYMLVNKFNYLSADYNPDDLVNISEMYAYKGHKIKQEAYKQYIKMWNAANAEGLTLIVDTSYRTFEQQQNIYNNSSDDLAARPGFSEHQTGLALDIINFNNNIKFADSNEYIWLLNNAYKYGFILRYPNGKEFITGFNFEPAHYRYVGVDVAKKIHDTNLTYDEYYAYYCEYKGEC